MSYWIVWPLGIVVWSLLGWCLFAYLEGNALRHPENKNYVTLSMFMYTLGSRFPLSILILGMIIGGFFMGLGVHFYWHWCPPGSISEG